jgi:phage gp36-like protein
MFNYQPQYTNFDELVELYPKISTVSLTSANIHGIYISKAEGEINAKLAMRYTVPFSSDNVPPIIKSIAQDISMYYLLRRIYTQNKKDKNPWLEEWKAARDLLDELAKGESILVDNSGIALDTRTDQQQIWSSTSTYKPAMDHREPIFQRIDPDRLDDEWNEDIPNR